MMRWMAPGAAIALLIVAAGCSGLPGIRLAMTPMATCKHCNCLMPTDTDPAALCRACRCGFPAGQCWTSARSTQCLLRAHRS